MRRVHRLLVVVGLVVGVAGSAHGRAEAQTTFLPGFTVTDVVYSAATDRLYATLPAGMRGPEPSIAVIDPQSGELLSRVVLPEPATQLAVSDDGLTLFAAVANGRAVRRYALPAMTGGAEFTLGTHPTDGPYTVVDMAVVPGTTGASIAISRAAGSRTVAIYDAGVPRPRTELGELLTFVAPDRLWVDFQDLPFDLEVRPDGVVRRSPTDTTSVSGVISVAGGRVFSGGGQVFDFQTLQLVGTYSGFVFRAAVPALDLDRVFMFGGGSMTAFEASTFRPLGTLPIAAADFYFGPALRTGPQRVALRGRDGQLVIGRDLAGTGLTPLRAAPPTNYWTSGLPPPVVAVTLAGCTVCRSGDLFRVDATLDPGVFAPRLELKAAVILPSGQALSLSALGSSHTEFDARNVPGPRAMTLLQARLPAGLPTGTWRYEVAALDARTGTVFSRIVVPFEVRP